MERRKLSRTEFEAAEARPHGWDFVDDRIIREWKFPDFASALDFVNRVGELAEAADHHPDIHFGWGYARIELTTHDRNGVTDVDLALAGKINDAAG
ncbi:MAG: 4a-hydroxytetrahydrobiopterin dehydratase [Blastocatellia bacterium]